jgi:ABC-type polysaccharide/polyol phosphate transport system ATPase subunit
LPDGAIQVEHVWKKFRADRTVPKFYDQMRRFGKSIGTGSRHDYRWVLKDVSFELPPGKTLALIGINGSGKTTMLKIISQVTYQSAGRCEVRGRIGALLSVVSGIHPELTGKENVYLYGAVMGMGRQTIKNKYDEMIEFAGLADASTGRSSSTPSACRCGSGSPLPPSSNRRSCLSTRCWRWGTPTSNRSASNGSERS